jgi:hypothetical protein
VLVPAFKYGGPGTRKEAAREKEVPAMAVPEPFLVFNAVSYHHQGLVRDVLLTELGDAGFSKVLSDAPGGVYEMQKEGKAVVIRMLDKDFGILIDAPNELHVEIRDALRRIADNLLGYRERLLSVIEVKPQEA